MKKENQLELSESALNAKAKLKEFQTKINPLIEEYFDKEIARVEKIYSTHAIKALEVYRDISTRRAKRLRASFIYYVYQMFGGTNLKEVIRVAVILEIVHAYLLMLDDFMDKSDTRRGGPTAHKIFEQYYHEQGFTKGDPVHYGQSIGASLGMMGFHMAMRLLSTVKIDTKIINEMLENINAKLVITWQGQILDVTNAVANKVSEKDILNMLKWKTGVYTYENPIQLGAIMANAKKSYLDKLSAYAIPAGIAFQIQDDILGVFGDPADTGKSVLDDLKEGKYTLLVHKALEKGTAKQKAMLQMILGNPDITLKDANEAKKIFEDTGSLEYSRKTALEFVKKAKRELQKGLIEYSKTEGYKYLIGIADYMIVREV